jgi:ribosomal protein S12
MPQSATIGKENKLKIKVKRRIDLVRSAVGYVFGYINKPKKTNSAMRKVAGQIINARVNAYIPGEDKPQKLIVLIREEGKSLPSRLHLSGVLWILRC